MSAFGGRLAQLGERRVRNAEVEGSSPLPSTISLPAVVPRRVGEHASNAIAPLNFLLLMMVNQQV